MTRHHATRFVRFAVAFTLLMLVFAVPAYAAELGNPLKPEFSSIQSFIAGALRALVMIALPILSLFIVYSGFLFVVARGNASELDKAKRNFMYVIIGSLLILGAWVLATLIGGTVSQIVGPS